MKRSNIVVVGLAVMLGLMVGSAEAMEKKRPQIQTAVTAVNFLNKATAASAAKKAQAGGNSFVSAVDDGVERTDFKGDEQAPMLMLTDRPRFTPKPPEGTAPVKNRVVRPSAPTESLVAAEPVVAVPQTRRGIEPLFSKIRGGKHGASEAPVVRGPRLQTQSAPKRAYDDGDMPVNTSPLKGSGSRVFGVGMPGAKSTDGFSRMPAMQSQSQQPPMQSQPIQPQSFKQRFVTGAKSFGNTVRASFVTMGSEIKKAGSRIAAGGRALKQRLTPAQQERIEALDKQKVELNAKIKQLETSGEVYTKAEIDALQKEVSSVEAEQARIEKAGRFKKGVRNMAVGMKNAASRVRNVFKKKPKAAAAAVDHSSGAAEAGEGVGAVKQSSAAARLASETVPAATPAVEEAVLWRQVLTKKEKSGLVFTPGLVTGRGNQPQEAVTSTVQLNTQRARPPLPRGPRPEQQQEPVVGMESPTGVAADLGMTKPVAARKLQALARKVIKVNNAIKEVAASSQAVSPVVAPVAEKKEGSKVRWIQNPMTQSREAVPAVPVVSAEVSSQISPSGLAGNRAERVGLMRQGKRNIAQVGTTEEGVVEPSMKKKSVVTIPQPAKRVQVSQAAAAASSKIGKSSPTQEELQAMMAEGRKEKITKKNGNRGKNRKKHGKGKQEPVDAEEPQNPLAAE